MKMGFARAQPYALMKDRVGRLPYETTRARWEFTRLLHCCNIGNAFRLLFFGLFCVSKFLKIALVRVVSAQVFESDHFA